MEEKRYAIASNGSTVASQVSDRAARAHCYLLFDSTGKILEIVQNPVSDTAGHAAPEAVGLLAGMGVSGVIAAGFGRRMLMELSARGIDHFQFQGTVETAIPAFLRREA